MDPVDALRQLGGWSRWPRLAALGVGRSTMVAACRAGLVQRPVRGLFVLPFAVDDPALRAAHARGQLSCSHAADAHGLDTFGLPDLVHVRVPRGSRRTERLPGVLLHTWGQKAQSDRTDLATTLRDCAHCLDQPEAVAVLDSALRSGRVTPGGLDRLARTWSVGAQRAAAKVDPKSQSVLESVARTVLTEEAVGVIASQVHVSRVGWVDLTVDGWLVLELDGYATHRATFREDRRRDAELTRLGFVVLRFTFGDLASRRAWFVDVVRETLERGRPPFWFDPQRDDFAARDRDTPSRRAP